MSIEIAFSETNHKFEKQNNITIKNKFGYYDLLKCSCGVKGKRYGISESVLIDGRTSKHKIYNCPNADLLEKIRITNFTGYSDQFLLLKAGSIHNVVKPPKGQTNDRGYWVKGVSEPVLVFFNECEKV